MLSSPLSCLPIILLALTLITSATAQGGAFGGFQQQTTAITSTTTTSSTIAGATSTSTNACTNSCLTTYPTKNYCKGTETGKALDACKCQSYSPLYDNLIACVLNCPTDQQYTFANSLPKLCAETLFLGLNLTPDKQKPYAINRASTPTFGAARVTGSAAASGNEGVRFGPKASLAGLGTLALGVAVFL